MSKLTLSMIVKNEEKYLRGCLESVKGVADEIVIVDTGSTDSTLEIAKEFNAEIYSFPWIKDFSAARNFALSKSTGDWILYLDADERLEEKSKNELLKKLKTKQKLGINCVVNSLDYNNSPTLMKYIRLFRNNKNISFIGKAHEQIEPSLIKNNYTIIDTGIEILHLGYNVPRTELQKKAERNLELLLIDYNKYETSYGAYQISNSYFLLDNIEKSIFYTQEALKDKGLDKTLKTVCYIRISDFELKRGNLIAAKKYLDEAISADKKHALLNLLASEIYHRFDENEMAINYCKNALVQNLKIKNKKKTKNVQDIIVDSKKILYQGLLLSLSANDLRSSEYFITELGKVDINEQILFQSIIKNEFLNENEIKSLIEVMGQNGLDLVLKLLERNSNNNFKLDFYSKIYDKFNTSSKYLIGFGAFLININQLNEAEIILKLSIDNEENNFSGIFYLASVYVQKQKYLELKELINTAEEKIEPNSLYFSKLLILKEKTSPLLKFTTV